MTGAFHNGSCLRSENTDFLMSRRRREAELSVKEKENRGFQILLLPSGPQSFTSLFSKVTTSSVSLQCKKGCFAKLYNSPVELLFFILSAAALWTLVLMSHRTRIRWSRWSNVVQEASEVGGRWTLSGRRVGRTLPLCLINKLRKYWAELFLTCARVSPLLLPRLLPDS